MKKLTKETILKEVKKANKVKSKKKNKVVKINDNINIVFMSI